MAFKKAEKSKAKLRLALFGTAGSGKTYTSLSIAQGLGDNIALIDSERGSSELYADAFDFDVAQLEKRNIDEYIKYIQEASQIYDVIIIDSISHAWQELLQEIDRLADSKYKGNTFRAWSEGTPRQRNFIDAIYTADAHIIATMRSKTEWTLVDNNGKKEPKRMGLTPEQGKNIEYEFSMLIDMSPEHNAHVIKDRTGKYQDKVIEKPGHDFGQELYNWLNTGKDKKSELLNEIENAPSVEELKNIWNKAGNFQQAIKSVLSDKKAKLQKPELTPDSQEWMEIIAQLAGGQTTTEEVEKKYTVTDKERLNEEAMQAYENMQEKQNANQQNS